MCCRGICCQWLGQPGCSRVEAQRGKGGGAREADVHRTALPTPTGDLRLNACTALHWTCNELSLLNAIQSPAVKSLQYTTEQELHQSRSVVASQCPEHCKLKADWHAIAMAIPVGVSFPSFRNLSTGISDHTMSCSCRQPR